MSVPAQNGQAITVGMIDGHACYVEVPSVDGAGRVTFHRAAVDRAQVRAVMSTLAEWPL